MRARIGEVSPRRTLFKIRIKDFSIRKQFFMPHHRLETIPILLVILWLLGWLV